MLKWVHIGKKKNMNLKPVAVVALSHPLPYQHPRVFDNFRTTRELMRLLKVIVLK